MTILLFSAGNEFFFIKIINNELFGSGRNSSFAFLKLKSLTTNKEQQAEYSRLEKTIKEMTSEQEIIDYITFECEKGGLKFVRTINDKEYYEMIKR